MRLGVVGGGLIAQIAHLPALRSLDAQFSVRALAEPSLGVRSALARRYGIAETYADHAELLARAQLDAVLVCSPNGTHARVVLDAIDAGLHVLVEKPLCLSPRDAEAIVERARERGRVVQVGYMKRFDPAYELLLEHVPGRLRLVSSATVDPGIGTRLRPAGYVGGAAAPDRETAAQVAEAIGSEDPRHVPPYSDAFAGALAHDVDLVLGAVDARWRVTDAATADDGTLAYGAWASEDGARWSALWQLAPAAGAFSETLRLFGADGVVSLRFPAPYHGSAPAQLHVSGEPERRWSPAANTYVRSLEHFHACVVEGEPCRSPASAEIVALLAELYRAAIAR